MKILLLTITSPGAPATERRFELPVLSLGRAADQDILLDDPRVGRNHAEIFAGKSLFGGKPCIRAKTALGVWIDNVPRQEAELSPGQVLGFGSLRLTVEKPRDGCDLVLTQHPRSGANEARSRFREQLRTSLADLPISRRSLSWLAFLLALGICMGLPLYSHYQQLPGAAATRIAPSHSPKNILRAGFLWDVGSGMTSGHKSLVKDCTACHSTPFTPVQDQRCTGCHTQLATHFAEARSGQHPLFASQNCIDCHREHKGPQALVNHGNAICVDCHSQPDDLPGRKLLAVKNFSNSHPAFSLRLPQASAASKTGFVWQEQRQGGPSPLSQSTGLKFPHDVHLASKGVDAPGGKRVMECANCHRPNADGSSFKPIEMASHCAECHRLDFDPLAPKRELPHGKPAEVVQVVRDYYARVALAGGVTDTGALPLTPNRRRPGAPSVQHMAPASLSWADQRANIALRDVFERRTCFYCHTVTVDPKQQPQWQIAPVAHPQPRYQGLVFSHAAHATEKCGSCHEAAQSKKTSDVLMPGIARCKDCHGDTGTMTETPSPCQSCHGYHQHPVPPPVAPPAAAPSPVQRGRAGEGAAAGAVTTKPINGVNP